MPTPSRPPAEMTYDELNAEIERTEAYLAELKEHAAFCIEKKEKQLRAELEALLEKKRALGAKGADDVPSRSEESALCTLPAGRTRRTKVQAAAEAKKIYAVIAAGRGLTRTDLQAALPDVSLPQNIAGTLARHGLRIKGTGGRRNRRYFAAD